MVPGFYTLFQAQQAFYKIKICFTHKAIFSECPFSFLCLLGKNVTFETLLMGDFPGRRNFKPFLGAGICFYFRHDTCFIVNP